MPSFVQIMAWRRPGDKPLSGQIMVRMLTHICVTRPQWVNNQTTECDVSSLWQVGFIILFTVRITCYFTIFTIKIHPEVGSATTCLILIIAPSLEGVKSHCGLPPSTPITEKLAAPQEKPLDLDYVISAWCTPCSEMLHDMFRGVNCCLDTMNAMWKQIDAFRIAFAMYCQRETIHTTQSYPVHRNIRHSVASDVSVQK